MKKYTIVFLCFAISCSLFANDFQGKLFEVRKGPENLKNYEFLFLEDSVLLFDIKNGTYTQYPYSVVGATIILGEQNNPEFTEVINTSTIPYVLKDGAAVLELYLGDDILTLYDTGRKQYRSNLYFGVMDKATVAVALLSGVVHANKNEPYESNGYKYQKDRNGNILEAKGDLRLEESVRNKTAQRLAGGEDRLPTDDGGHLVANRFGGSGELDNLVAMDRTLNRGGWKAMENSWEKALVEGYDVNFIIKPKYWYSSRPYAFKVIDFIGEERHVYRFSN